MGWTTTVSAPGVSVQPDGARPVYRALPEEAPVAFVCDGSSIAVMMATPTDIEDFACGFALTEGIVASPDELGAVEVAAHPDGIEARIWLPPEQRVALEQRRRFLAGPVG